MKERPIIFSTPMVQAILSGTKTQTRRLLKPQPKPDEYGYILYPPERDRCFMYPSEASFRKYGAKLQAPHGKPGDWLWVKETFGMAIPLGESIRANRIPHYRADGVQLPRWTPAIFMPRSASRITLEIRDVRVERLQDITSRDAEEEGIEYTTIETAAEPNRIYEDYFTGEFEILNNPVTSFRTLWGSINEKKAPWSSNPWVWVYSFKRISEAEHV